MSHAGIPGRGDSGCRRPERGAGQADSELARRRCHCRGEKRRVCSWMQVEVGAIEASSRGEKWLDSSVTGSPGWYNSLGVSMEAVRTGDV